MDESAMADFDQEITLLRRLRHRLGGVISLRCKHTHTLSLFPSRIIPSLSLSNVVFFYGAGTSDSSSFLVTEYCARGSLNSILRNSDIALDWPMRMRMLVDTGESTRPSPLFFSF